MSEQMNGPAPKEVILKPVDLARSYLGHEGAELIRNIRLSEMSLNFDRNYDPNKNRQSRPSYIESGSMDASDWDLSELEAQDWEENRDSIIEAEELELENLRDDELRNRSEFGKVLHGDNVLIDKYSKLEIARREELEKAKANQAK